ncbi:hypothetical protein PFISCL1PPCAC_22310, partial [Pristionchus fissidentatus]
EKKEEQEPFPILDLPAELSAKILSFMEKRELSVCLQSINLDKIHVEWNKDKIIDGIQINQHGKNAEIVSERYDKLNFSPSFACIRDRIEIVFSKCEIGTMIFELTKNCEESRGLVELCKEIRCTNLLYINSFTYNCNAIVTDDSLRQLLSNKKDVDFELLCEGVTAAGLFAVWENLLDGVFEGLSIVVKKTVATDLFDMLRTDGEMSVWNDYNLYPIEASGRNDARYELWFDGMYATHPVIRMSRIYKRRRWISYNYEEKSEDEEEDSESDDSDSSH